MTHDELQAALESDELIEILANVEHERWAGWMRHVFIVCSDGKTMPDWGVEHWGRQMKALYRELPEDEKEADREEVRKTLKAVRDYLYNLKQEGR